MAAFEVIALNESTPQLLAPGASDTYTMPRSLSIAACTLANPALRLAGDTNTGWYSRSAGFWTFGAGGTAVLDLNSSANGMTFNQSVVLGWGSGTPFGGPDSGIARAAANSLVYGGSSIAAGAVTSRTEINKAVASIANNSATAVLTFTVPNAAHSASFLIELVGSSGAGGSIGANESTQSARYQVDIARTSGVNAVATIGAVFGQPAAATVAGGTAIATTAALSAISGAVGASNTFTVNVTIARAGGAATNHTCLVCARLLNANATGVTVA